MTLSEDPAAAYAKVMHAHTTAQLLSTCRRSPEPVKASRPIQGVDAIARLPTDSSSMRTNSSNDSVVSA
ncbi:hypothetical protein MMC25_004384 [Agyrium rufum]|nr:hypothetical protein [Agyrium rufum]